MQASDSQSDFDFNDRYGVRPQRGWLPYAISFLIIGGAWTVWAGFHHADPPIAFSLLSFNNQDPRKTEITYVVTRRDPSHPATCTLVARDFDKVIVGEIIDKVPAADGPIQRTVTIASRADAVNAGVITCYLD